MPHRKRSPTDRPLIAAPASVMPAAIIFWTWPQTSSTMLASMD
jgi:hypothetical protein